MPESNSNLVLIVVVSLLVTIGTSYMTMRLTHKYTYDWWYYPPLDDNLGTTLGGSKYSTKFSIDSLFAWQTSSLLALLTPLLVPPAARMNGSQNRFIFQRVLPYMLYVDEDHKAHGIVTPKSMCETVILTTACGDWIYNGWYKHEDKRKGDRRLGPLDETYTLRADDTVVYDHSVDSVNYKYTERVDGPNSSGRIGLWPRARDVEGWEAVFLDWLNYDADGKSITGSPFSWEHGAVKNTWVLKKEGDNIWMISWYGDMDKVNANNWFDRPDNFLGRMNIAYDSPLATYFINQLANVQSMPVDIVAFTNLVGEGSAVVGGWVGYCQGMMGKTSDQLDTYVSGHVQRNVPPPPPSCRKKFDIGKGAMAGVASGLSIGVMAAFPLGPGALPLVLIGALVSGGIAGYQAGKPNC